MAEVATSDRIAAAFAGAAERGRSAALMPYLMGGFPDAETSRAVAEAYVDAGADLIELGVPFSDPLADGAVIHSAGTKALEAGATLDSVLEICRALSDRVPVVPMCYANLVLHHGPDGFAARLSEVGAAGAIVPDLPREEADEIRAALSAAGLPLIPLVAPTTPPQRRRRICEEAEGFVYLVSTAGVTGEREALPPELTELVAPAKADASVPVAVGFGIATPEQASAVGEIADGVIIGTRLVRAVADAPDVASAAEEVTEFLGRVGEALGR